MTYKDQLVRNGSSIFVLIACSLLFVGINSCNSGADQSTTTNATTGTGTDTTDAQALTVNLPEYVINATALPGIAAGGAGLQPSKFLLKFEFTSTSNPLRTMKLLLYPANDHGHYGYQVVPIQFSATNVIAVDNATNLVLGNNEIATTDLVLPPGNEYYFDYIKLTPDVITNDYDGKPHLLFHVSAYSSAGALIKEKGKKAFTIPDTNPCPPNRPAD